MGRLRLRSARGRLQAKPKRLCFFVILVMHPTFLYKDGGKPSEWRWGWVLSWKIPEFCSMGGARSKQTAAFFALLGYPSTILRTTYRKQFYPKPMVPNTDGKPRFWRCAFCRMVCDQAFGTSTESSRNPPINWCNWPLQCTLLDLRVSATTNITTWIYVNQRRCTLAGCIGPWRVPKSGYVTITKIKNLHTGTRRKNSLIPKMLFFSIYDEK